MINFINLLKKTIFLFKLILNKSQSGFRPGFSTETAMMYVTDLLLTEMDSKLTGVVFFDLKSHSIQLIMQYSLLNLGTRQGSR